MRKVTWVIIDEVKDGDWGIAGTPMTCASVGKIKHGASAPV
jgi:phenylpyruvate tautomerase PptA (4-oxalocrotonate tautomerase family)